MPFESAHSKTVKRAIVMLCLKEALQKSCVHLVKDSLNNQIGRLQKAGFPVSVVAAVAEKLLQSLKPRTPQEGGGQPKTRPAVLPYIHRVSHNLKNVANRYGVPVVFSAPRKLASLCPGLSPARNACETARNVTPPSLSGVRSGLCMKFP